MSAGIFIGLLWLSVAWRVWLSWRDWSAERRGLAIALGFFAATATTWVYGHALNGWLGVPNVSTLLTRLFLGTCWLAAQPFVARFLHAHSGRTDHGRPRRWVSVVTGLMMVSSVVIWWLAPLHDAELMTLNAAPDAWTTLFVTISYLWVALLLADLANASLRAFGVMANDPPGRASAALLALTGVLGLVGIALLALDRIVSPGSQYPSVYGVVGSAFMPAVAATTALGMLAVPTGEWVLAQRDARRQIRALRPAWSSMVGEHPELVVPLPWWTRLLDAPLLAERMRIELVDAADEAQRAEVRSPRIAVVETT